ncbi:MAG TPA: NB-ARC domain-containing protein, partial [Anaerolineae bacterium]|nr:NB-ARC domain-containing protein [Anaerolineae bacterium]
MRHTGKDGPMDDHDALQRTLARARRALQILEEEKAGFGALRVPVDLQIELEEKRREVASLEARLAQLEGRSPARLPDNLPRRPSIFVGRKQELARCLTALSPQERGWGVVIDGIGGIGKTALALEAAHAARRRAWFDAYLFVSAKTSRLTPDGIREETLAATSLDAFTRRFAALLGEREIEEMSDAGQRYKALLDALRGRRALLIWDNLETLTREERDRIAEFLRVLPAPNKAIVTSRRRTGESALTVRLDRLSEEEGFRLMDEVGRRHPAVARELARAGRETRRALYDAAGGNPLALHWTLGLAAQKGYSLREALARLQDAARSGDLYRFLFAEAARDLAEADRTVLSALTAFQTPATPAALADVTGRTAQAVQAALERLVTLSLVNDLGEERYGLHPLTRTYVRAALREEVQEPPLAPAAHRRTLRFWVDYAQK